VTGEVETSGCPGCGVLLVEGARFCLSCGTHVESGERHGTPAELAAAIRELPELSEGHAPGWATGVQSTSSLTSTPKPGSFVVEPDRAEAPDPAAGTDKSSDVFATAVPIDPESPVGGAAVPIDPASPVGGAAVPIDPVPPVGDVGVPIGPPSGVGDTARPLVDHGTDPTKAMPDASEPGPAPRDASLPRPEASGDDDQLRGPSHTSTPDGDSTRPMPATASTSPGLGRSGLVALVLLAVGLIGAYTLFGGSDDDGGGEVPPTSGGESVEETELPDPPESPVEMTKVATGQVALEIPEGWEEIRIDNEARYRGASGPISYTSRWNGPDPQYMIVEVTRASTPEGGLEAMVTEVSENYSNVLVSEPAPEEGLGFEAWSFVFQREGYLVVDSFRFFDDRSVAVVVGHPDADTASAIARSALATVEPV